MSSLSKTDQIRSGAQAKPSLCFRPSSLKVIRSGATTASAPTICATASKPPVSETALRAEPNTRDSALNAASLPPISLLSLFEKASQKPVSDSQTLSTYHSTAPTVSFASAPTTSHPLPFDSGASSPVPKGSGGHTKSIPIPKSGTKRGSAGQQSDAPSASNSPAFSTGKFAASKFANASPAPAKLPIPVFFTSPKSPLAADTEAVCSPSSFPSANILSTTLPASLHPVKYEPDAGRRPPSQDDSVLPSPSTAAPKKTRNRKRSSDTKAKPANGNPSVTAEDAFDPSHTLGASNPFFSKPTRPASKKPSKSKDKAPAVAHPQGHAAQRQHQPPPRSHVKHAAAHHHSPKQPPPQQQQPSVA